MARERYNAPQSQQSEDKRKKPSRGRRALAGLAGLSLATGGFLAGGGPAEAYTPADAAPVPTAAAPEVDGPAYEQETPSTFVTMTSERVAADDQLVRSGVAAKVTELTSPKEGSTTEQSYNPDGTLIVSMSTPGVGYESILAEKPTIQPDGRVTVHIMRTVEDPGGMTTSSDTVTLTSTAPEIRAMAEDGSSFTIAEVNNLLDADSTTRVDRLTHLTPGGETDVTLHNDLNADNPALSKVGVEVSAAGPYDYRIEQPPWTNLSVDEANQAAADAIGVWRS